MPWKQLKVPLLWEPTMLSISGVWFQKVEGKAEGGAQKMGCVVGRSVPEESEQCGEPHQPPTHAAEEQGLVPLSVAFPTCPLLIATRKPQSSDVCYPKRRVRAGDPGVLLACPCCSSSSAYALRGNILVPLCMAACSPHIMCLR